MSDPCSNAKSCDCDPQFQIAPPNPPPPPIVYQSTRQCATAFCTDGQVGQDVTVCVSAGLFTSTLSQADADALAYADALTQANGLLDCGLAGQLNGLRFEMPCTSGLTEGVCDCSDPPDNSQVAQGNPGQLYTVQLRVRGLVELKPYSHYGLAGAGNGLVFVCSNPTQAIPAVPGHGDNEYCITISDPPATIMLNNSTGNSAPTQSTRVDYQVTVFIRTGGVITIKARSIDGQQWGNGSNAVINSAPPPVGVSDPYNGQVLELFVMSIT